MAAEKLGTQTVGQRCRYRAADTHTHTHTHTHTVSLLQIEEYAAGQVKLFRRAAREVARGGADVKVDKKQVSSHSPHHSCVARRGKGRRRKGGGRKGGDAGRKEEEGTRG